MSDWVIVALVAVIIVDKILDYCRKTDIKERERGDKNRNDRNQLNGFQNGLRLGVEEGRQVIRQSQIEQARLAEEQKTTKTSGDAK